MKKNKEISNYQSVKNNIYALSFLYSIAKNRVFHTFFVTAIEYFDLIFYSSVVLRYILNAIESEKPFYDIVVVILGVGLFILFLVLYRLYVENFSNPVTNVRIYNKVYRRLYSKSSNVELYCYENPDFYSKYTMAMDGADAKLIEVVTNLAKTIIGFIALIWISGIMFSIDSFVVVFIIFPIIGNLIFGSLLNKLYYLRYKDVIYHQRRIDYVNRVMYLVDYAKELRLSNIYKIIKRDYNDAVMGIEKVADKYSKKGTVLFFFQTYFTFTLIFEGVLLYGTYRALYNETMPLADLAVLTSVMSTVSIILMDFTGSLMKLLENGIFVNNFKMFLQYEEKIPENQNGIIPDNTINTIEFKNVSFGYKEEEYVIRNLSFTINNNQRIALVGTNGAGKTTIVKLLLRLYDPIEGVILVNGIDIRNYNLAEYRSRFSCVFQDYKLFSDSLYENVSMGRKKTQEKVQEAIVKAKAHEDVKALKNGINTIVSKEFDDDGVVLSGGQQQKIAIARAIAQNGTIKVFDEPTGAIDPITEYELFQSLLEQSGDGITLFISHRLSTVKNADFVFMLENGKIIESGTHNDLMLLNGKYAKMYNYQANNYMINSER